MLECAEMFKLGLPPVAGGTLDQAAAFTEAARFAWQETDYWEFITGGGANG